MTIRARPHINGNTVEAFREAYHQVFECKQKLQEAEKALAMNVFHGRNYQHMEAAEANMARELDDQKLARLRAMITDLDRLSTELAFAVINHGK